MVETAGDRGGAGNDEGETSMNVTAVKTAFVAALRASGSDLDVWCQSTYGTGCWVYIGIDEDNPPGSDRCPCVEVAIPGRVTGPDVSMAEYFVSVVLTLHDESVVDHNDPMIVEHAGIDRLEVFSAYVFDIFLSVLDALANNATVSEHVVENGPVESFPLFQTGSLYRITEPRTIGQNPY